MRSINSLVEQYRASGAFPCGEVLLAHGQHVLLHEAYGYMEGSDIAPLKKGALFDLASLTKPLATANILVQLVRHGDLNPDARVVEYLPQFKAAGDRPITIRQLALHQSGLPADAPLAKRTDQADTAWQMLFDMKLTYAPGTQMVYSCLGYLLLGKIIENVTGKPLDRAFDEMIARPLGLTHSLFSPLAASRSLPPIVPTVPDIRAGGFVRGMVNDSTARLLGGNVGNAGLFSTAQDLHLIALNLLERADPLIFKNGNWPNLTPRTFGFEYNDPQKAICSCGPNFPEDAVGHTGFTGTSLWVDPATKLIVIALTNRVFVSHRSNMDAMKQFRIDLHAEAQKIHEIKHHKDGVE